MAFNYMKRKADMFKRINDQRARLKRMDEADKRDQAAKQNKYEEPAPDVCSVCKENLFISCSCIYES